jgi:DegV family protein with EDD domain
MAKVAIVTDSGSGITLAQAMDLGIGLVSTPFMFGDNEKTYFEDINLTRDEFFTRLKSGETVHTSQPSPVDVLKVWDQVLENNDSLVYIPMSSGLSGSCQSAMMLSGDYDGKVEVVNNQRISVTQRRSVMDAVEMAAKGWTAREIKEKLEEVRYEQSIYIMVDTLTYLKRGGRITPAAAAIGTLLKIKPVLKIFGERLDAFAKARTAQQGRTMMINAMKSDCEKLYGGMDNVWLYSVESKSPEFESWTQQVKGAFEGHLVETDQLPSVINCHIGEGALAIACSKKLEIEDRTNR